MDRQEFKELFESADGKLYGFYRNCLYHMQEHPMLFWILLAFALWGAVSLLW